jgi:hypothetical protein
LHRSICFSCWSYLFLRSLFCLSFPIRRVFIVVSDHFRSSFRLFPIVHHRIDPISQVSKKTKQRRSILVSCSDWIDLVSDYFDRCRSSPIAILVAGSSASCQTDRFVKKIRQTNANRSLLARHRGDFVWSRAIPRSLLSTHRGKFVWSSAWVAIEALRRSLFSTPPLRPVALQHSVPHSHPHQALPHLYQAVTSHF